MKYSSTFLISAFSLVCLSSMMLANAEETLFPQIVTLPLAILALLMTHRLGRFCLPLALANALGVIALTYTLFQMKDVLILLLNDRSLPEEGVGAELVIGARLLTFLSWIVFFMEKQIRHFWWLCGLSILQVAVGGVLVSTEMYGGLLIGYVFLAVWTLSLLSVEQVRRQFALSEGQKGEMLVAIVGHRAVQGQPRIVAWLRQPSISRPAIQLDPSERWISVRYLLGYLATTVSAMLVAGFFVVFTPRAWIQPRSSSLAEDFHSHSSTIGFSETVELGNEGTIVSSSEPVLEMKVFDNDTGEELRVNSVARQLGYQSPLFRGAVMSTYDGHSWKAGDEPSQYVQYQGLLGRNFIRQEYRLQPLDTDILFAMHPVLRCRVVYSEVRPFRTVNSWVYRRDRRDNNKPLEYILYAKRYRNRDRSPAAIRSPEDAWHGRRQSRRYLQLPHEGLNGLKEISRELADRVTGSHDDSTNDRVEDDRSARTRRIGTRSANAEQIAKTMERYLRDSGDFGYSLSPQVFDRSLDPVEDFLVNRKTGHCEYYASALALMLRSVGIPSRLVTGYKGGTRNKFSGYFEVQQRHAHAWVEAYVGDRRWITLDPTPSDERERSLNSMAPKMLTLHDFKTFAQGFWSNYVANASIGRQQTKLYTPIGRSLKAMWNRVANRYPNLPRQALALKEFITTPQKWRSWTGVVVAATIVGGILLFAWLRHRAYAWFKRIMYRLTRRSRRSVRPHIEFYERFQAICRKRGLNRRAAQTHREFALTVQHSLSKLLATTGMPEMPRELVEAFYAVRFGNRPIDQRQLDEMGRQLGQLEKLPPGGRIERNAQG